jgi:TolA-binding protein
MKTIDFNYFIERYLDNEMEPAEKNWFEKEIEGNDSLRKELELRRRTDSVLRNSDIMGLRAQINAIEKEKNRENDWTAARRRMLRYAALATIVLITGTSIWLPNRKMSNDSIFDKYYQFTPTATNEVTRSSVDQFNPVYQAALNNFENGQFDQAINYFLSFTSDMQSNNEDVQMGVEMMLGHSYAGVKKYNEAGLSYKKVIDQNDNLYIEDANWLLGLCYIKTDNNDQARSQMKVIAESESRYRKDAASVLRKMKRK